ncbi:hypothetical protein ACFQPC_05445 [Herminiimonas glaciei]|uniref:Uncharacterized protein n=1 Tax=Herminiimonas glaciei TaxID=523788 RepID=A0ABW2I8Z1_9BURK
MRFTPDTLTLLRHPALRTLLGLGLAASCLNTHAARPMITDDARIVDAKACQVESWVKSNKGSTEYWAIPACNFTGNLEVSFGGSAINQNGSTQNQSYVIQGKTLFKTLEPNGWGIGLAFGNAMQPRSDTERHLLSSPYAYVPASFSFKDDRFVLHTNVGWLHDKPNNRNRATWGLGSETQLAERTWLIAETFDQSAGKPFYQLGVRHWLVPDHVQIDTTYGNRFGSGSEERWISIGLRLLSVPFLP